MDQERLRASVERLLESTDLPGLRILSPELTEAWTSIQEGKYFSPPDSLVRDWRAALASADAGALASVSGAMAETIAAVTAIRWPEFWSPDTYELRSWIAEPTESYTTFANALNRLIQPAVDQIHERPPFVTLVWNLGDEKGCQEIPPTSDRRGDALSTHFHVRSVHTWEAIKSHLEPMTSCQRIRCYLDLPRPIPRGYGAARDTGTPSAQTCRRASP